MKLAVFQSACGGLTPSDRIEELRSVLDGADVDLVVCPELFMSGYNVGEELRTLSQSADSGWFQDMSEVAKEADAHIVYGYPERSAADLYNTAACVSPDGQLVASHRKRANSPNSFEETYFTPGEHMTMFECSGVKVAVLICYEVEFPEMVREAALHGAQLVIVPTALVEQWDIVASRIVPARAFENGVWLAYANHGGKENGFTYLGGSRIVAPDGSEVAIAGTEQELIVADLDLERVSAAQARLPYLRDVKRLEMLVRKSRGL